MAGGRKVLIIAVLVAVWCAAMVRRCSAPSGAAVPAAARRPVAAVRPDAAAPDAGVDAPGVDAAVAVAPVDAEAADPVHDRVWAAQMMVSPDGAQIFLPISHSDGARGEANLEFEIWNRAGKPLRHLAIKSVDEYLGEGAPAGLAGQLRARERRAAAMLDELQAAGFTAEPLVEISSADPASGERSHAELVVAGEPAPRLTIDLRLDGRLTVKPRDHAAITRRDRAWAGTRSPAEQRAAQKAWDEGRQACFNPGFLRGAMVDLSHRFALVWVGYRGNDSCWEGDDARVLIAW